MSAQICTRWHLVCSIMGTGLLTIRVSTLKNVKVGTLKWKYFVSHKIQVPTQKTLINCMNKINLCQPITNILAIR